MQKQRGKWLKYHPVISFGNDLQAGNDPVPVGAGSLRQLR
ncbi:hypothetical protein DOT_1050 [Desulfosporosinus sp. OT]|nr:hypothetical protein DOT_1050 [Desulfosporosinus sp. OT]